MLWNEPPLEEPFEEPERQDTYDRDREYILIKNNPMNKYEHYKLKQKLAEEIENMIRRFEIETGIIISNINRRTEITEEPNTSHYKIKNSIELFFENVNIENYQLTVQTKGTGDD